MDQDLPIDGARKALAGPLGRRSDACLGFEFRETLNPKP